MKETDSQQTVTTMKTKILVLSLLWLPSVAVAQTLPQGDIARMEELFRELPMEAKRLTGPLFWLHGAESKERLESYVQKTAESGNGSFTAESRPHRDWLGEGWYRDLAICLEAAKQHDLEMWIFDEKWWPSQMIGGKVPAQYATKVLVAETVDVDGPRTIDLEGYGGERYVAAVAGRVADGGAIDGESLIDLAGSIKDGRLTWQAPAGKWQVIKFTHKQGPGLGQGNSPSIDGASQDCTDYFIQTVYQPHFDRFQDDFGKTIPGFFYDEPETRGDWGTELNRVLAEWKVDWKKAYVAHTLKLAGEDDTAAKFQYLDAFAEAWGRTMYGTMSRWCRERGVKSMGHFMEHGYLYVHPEFCAGDMMRLQKYSDMGGIDLVVRQMYPGQRPRDIYQTPKLGSSITHVFGKADDITMCEMFGAYGQDITYSQMKWLTDQMQVRGVNFMIPHSFNPKAPYDTDCPPYFYNGGFEPRYPLYRVYADYTSRLSLLLSGGRHVCPVAVLFAGNLRRVGKMTTPEDITSSLQDALFDCDWLPMEVFTGEHVPHRRQGNQTPPGTLPGVDRPAGGGHSVRDAGPREGVLRCRRDCRRLRVPADEVRDHRQDRCGHRRPAHGHLGRVSHARHEGLPDQPCRRTLLPAGREAHARRDCRDPDRRRGSASYAGGAGRRDQRLAARAAPREVRSGRLPGLQSGPPGPGASLPLPPDRGRLPGGLGCDAKRNYGRAV